MNRETLAIDPTASQAPHMQEGFSDIDMQLLQAHNQLATQVETLAVDPSLSPEQEKEKNEAIYRAVGAMSLATEGLDYDTMVHQTELNNHQAYVTEVMNQQISEAMRRSVDDESDSDKEDDKKHFVRKKHHLLFGAR